MFGWGLWAPDAVVTVEQQAKLSLLSLSLSFSLSCRSLSHSVALSLSYYCSFLSFVAFFLSRAYSVYLASYQRRIHKFYYSKFIPWLLSVVTEDTGQVFDSPHRHSCPARTNLWGEVSLLNTRQDNSHAGFVRSKPDKSDFSLFGRLTNLDIPHARN